MIGNGEYILKKVRDEEGGSRAENGRDRYQFGKILGIRALKRRGLKQITEGLIEQNPVRESREDSCTGPVEG